MLSRGAHSIEAWTHPASGKNEGTKIMHIFMKVKGKKDKRGKKD